MKKEKITYEELEKDIVLISQVKTPLKVMLEFEEKDLDVVYQFYSDERMPDFIRFKMNFKK